MNYDNPAARLLVILKKGKNIPAHEGCRNTWMRLLEAKNESEILSRLGLIMKLSEDVALAVTQNFTDEAESVEYWKSQLTSAFTQQQLLGQWQSFIQHIDSHSINYLKSHSQMLGLVSNTKPIVDEEIRLIREKLVALHEEVLASDINQDIKKFLVRYLKKIMLEIDEYFLTGALPIIEAVEAAIGHAALDKSYKDFLWDTEFGKRILDVLGATANVVTVAIGLPQLPMSLSLLLSSN